MTRKQSFLSITIVFLVIILACSGVDTSPPGNPTPLPVSTSTPAQGDGPTQPTDLETATVAEVVDGDTIELTDGRQIGVPLAYFPRLLQGSPEQRARWEMSGGGTGLHWEELDEDISVPGLLAAVPPQEVSA